MRAAVSRCCALGAKRGGVDLRVAAHRLRHAKVRLIWIGALLSAKHAAPFRLISLTLLKRPCAVNALHGQRTRAGDVDFLAGSAWRFISRRFRGDWWRSRSRIGALLPEGG